MAWLRNNKGTAIARRAMQRQQNTNAVRDIPVLVSPVTKDAASLPPAPRRDGMDNKMWRDGVADLKRQHARGVPLSHEKWYVR